MPESDLLDVKLESLSRCVDRIKSNTPETAEQLTEDYDAQDIVAVNLQRAIQICVDLGGHLLSTRGWAAPSSMAETFIILADHGVLDKDLAERLRRAVGFRNSSLREYEKIDWVRVHRIVTEILQDFRLFGRELVDAWPETDQ